MWHLPKTMRFWRAEIYLRFASTLIPLIKGNLMIFSDPWVNSSFLLCFWRLFVINWEPTNPHSKILIDWFLDNVQQKCPKQTQNEKKIHQPGVGIISRALIHPKGCMFFSPTVRGRKCKGALIPNSSIQLPCLFDVSVHLGGFSLVKKIHKWYSSSHQRSGKWPGWAKFSFKFWWSFPLPYGRNG